jgi:regulatory factor X
MQLLEVEFVAILESLMKSNEPVREVMSWADKCCERLMGGGRPGHGGPEERSSMSSRSVLIRWGYVTSQVMRDLVCHLQAFFVMIKHLLILIADNPKRPRIRCIPNFETILRVRRAIMGHHTLAEHLF